MFEQHGQGHAGGAHEREVAESLNVFLHGFSSFLNCRKEFIFDYLGVILVELRKQLGFQVNPRIDRAIGKAPKPVKDYPP